MSGAAVARSRLMAHLVAFFPDRSGSLEAARGLVEGGCTYLEVQFPFSDPTADGPDIERACHASLASGFTVSGGFALLEELSRVCRVPVFLMSYGNLPFTRGMERFIRECLAVGVRGIIVPDLVPDADAGLFPCCEDAGLAAVPVVSPSMKEERLRRVAGLGCEFMYATLRSGTTGSLTSVDDGSLSFLKSIGSLAGARQPKVFGGFGVATRQQVEEIEPHVHAVVVGSAIVRAIAGSADPRRATREKVRELLEVHPRS